MKVKKKKNSGSVKVQPAVLQESREICVRENFSISDYVTEAIREYNKKYKKVA
jgi:hypothetical protein